MSTEMKIFPVRPPSVPFEKFAKAHGDYGWHTEGGTLHTEGEVLVLNTIEGEARFVWDWKRLAYRRLPDATSVPTHQGE